MIENLKPFVRVWIESRLPSTLPRKTKNIPFETEISTEKDVKVMKEIDNRQKFVEDEKWVEQQDKNWV